MNHEAKQGDRYTVTLICLDAHDVCKRTWTALAPTLANALPLVRGRRREVQGESERETQRDDLRLMSPDAILLVNSDSLSEQNRSSRLVVLTLALTHSHQEADVSPTQCTFASGMRVLAHASHTHAHPAAGNQSRCLAP